MSLSDLNGCEGIALFTDGSAWNVDKSGGWAWIAIDAFDGVAQDSGGVRGTTNNRMEMMAWIEGLKAIHETLGPSIVIVYSDSEYVGLGAIDRRRGRTCNMDLWKLLDAAVDSHVYVEFAHIKGHRGHEWNELVDKLAGEARLTCSAPISDIVPRKKKPRTRGMRKKKRR